MHALVPRPSKTAGRERWLTMRSFFFGSYRVGQAIAFRGLHCAGPQNRNSRLALNCREIDDEVTFPNVLLVRIADGAFRLAWFKELYASIRNRRLNRSATRKFFVK